MNQQTEPDDRTMTSIINSNRAVAIVLFCLYSLFMTYWFSSVVQLLSPGLIVLCCVLAWGSLKVNANWIFLGEVIVLLAKYGWQSPRVELIPGLWLGYVGLMLFVFRAKYTSIHSALCRDVHRLATEERVVVRRLSIRFVFSVMYALLGGMALIVSGFLLLAYSPFGGAGNAWINWSLDSNEAMWPGASAISILIGAVVLVREWNWRRASRMQASVYLRADRIGWQYRELSRVVRLVLKEKNKK
ncbi:MAG: hypothetical protein MUC43_07255 [Pirellula sp.]|jgi:hypothetical protein|nr:hypothetical protein [Pirellula sp.]